LASAPAVSEFRMRGQGQSVTPGPPLLIKLNALLEGVCDDKWFFAVRAREVYTFFATGLMEKQTIRFLSTEYSNGKEIHCTVDCSSVQST